MPEYYDSRERVSDLEWIARSSFASALIETLGNMIKYYKEANLSEESKIRLELLADYLVKIVADVYECDHAQQDEFIQMFREAEAQKAANKDKD